jgi:hypothetical protein
MVSHPISPRSAALSQRLVAPLTASVMSSVHRVDMALASGINNAAATEWLVNHVDTVWPYWNLMDFTPDGRPDLSTPPQNFRSEFLEKNYLDED